MSKEKLFDHIQEIQVEPRLLCLDPNNPRFMDYHSDIVPKENYLDSAIITKTVSRMQDPKNKFQIEPLITSILTNGYQDYDSIFVEKYPKTDKYIVLEGNRRVTAIHEIIDKENAAKYRKKFKKYNEIVGSLTKIEVLELDSNLDEATRDEMVRYILGIRHGKQIKQWPKFAIGRRVYDKYLEVAKQTEDSFEWDENAAHRVAEEWTILDKEKISADSVREILITIRLMEQAMAVDGYKVEAKHWSLMLAGFAKGAEEGVNKDMPYNHKTFLLDEDGLKHLNRLCRFDQPRRSGAAINNPQQWSKYSKILTDPELSEEEREKYLERVLGGEMPSTIIDEIAASREVYDWEKWLEETRDILKSLLFNDYDLDDKDSEKQVKRMFTVISTLDSKDAN